MDQIARNNFDATLYFDKVAPAPRRVFHNLTRPAKQSNVLPKLVLWHPPELASSYSRVQRKPINIFKKLVPKLGTSLPQKSGCKCRGRRGDSGMKERSKQKTGHWNVERTMTPPSSIIPSDAPAFEQALSVESSPSSSVYSPQSALIQAPGLAFDHVSAIEPLSYPEGVQRVKFSCLNVKPTRSQARVLRRKSRYPHPMVLSPPPSIPTPPRDIASLASISPQKDIRGQKILKRYGRCPSDFLDLGLTNPIYWPNIEQAGTDIVLDPATSTPPPRFDSLRGYSRASLEKAMEVTEETKSVPSKASLRPKLMLQIPKTGGPSQRTVIHRPVATIRHCKDDIKLDTRRPRPSPTIPFTRQRSV